jgi:hypothetical protein
VRADLLLRSLERIRNTTEVCPARIEIKREVRGPRVTVARLADRARVEQPSFGATEVEVGRVRSEPARERPIVDRERERNVTMADENDRLIRGEDRCSRGLRGQDVFPHGITGARVVEAHAARVCHRLE